MAVYNEGMKEIRQNQILSEQQKWNQRPKWDGHFSWVNSSFLFLTPLISLAAFIFLLYTKNFSWFDFSIFLMMFFATGLSITAGYHRLFSHQSYKSSSLIQLFYLLFGAASFQNSALKWSSDHRYHHRFVDKESDPYNIQEGFFWAHIGWILYGDPEHRSYDNVKDLQKNPLVLWQHRYYVAIAIIMSFAFPTLVGAIFGRALEGLIWGGLFRLVFVHHTTFLINSAAHVFGKKNYSEKNSARDCWWLAFFTNGEGYHNFHHAFANDYRNGIRWYQWDPSKWLIYCLQFLGLSSDLKRTPDWQILRTKMEKKYHDFQNIIAQKPKDISARYEEQVVYLKEQLNKHIESVARKNTSCMQSFREQQREMRRAWNEYCDAIALANQALSI